ncbi:hypothetical protein MBLNU459_g3939t1 [Dothideomycetes sp. NU459]
MAADFPDDEPAAEEHGSASNGADHAAPPVIAVSDAADNVAVPKDVDNVMYSDIGITTLLNRLKQSIASAKDFAAFLKKRSSIEEDQAQGLRRLAKSTQDSIRRTDSRQGSYVRQLEEVMRLHERLADNGMQFALSLHQMHEDLNDLSTNMERGRKNWKHEGLNAEKRATDAESMMEKAKAKYDSLAEDYDRARTGDAKGSRRIGLKGPKSAAQHEEDLLRKLQAADSDYQTKVQTAKAQREELIRTSRPQAVKALQELITECDAGLGLQLQKFATFNEKLLLGNGLAVSPLAPADGSLSAHRSMRDIVLNIDNTRDFHTYISSHASKIPIRTSDIRYEQHPTLLPKQSTPAPQSRQPSASLPQPSPPTISTATFSGPATQPQQYGSANSRNALSSAPAAPQPPAQSPSYSNDTPSSPPYPTQPPQQQYNTPPYPTANPSPRGFPSQQTSGVTYGNSPVSYNNGNGIGNGQSHSMGQPQSLAQNRATSPAPANLPPPLKPVFGVGLEELFRRDGTAVPMVVYQCMQAVDLFGLDVEGIYRLSGTASHVQQIKALFDHDSARVDFRNPAAFYHDVNSVAGLLKQFFRDLPDPLMTHAHYSRFIEAARLDDDVIRRDTVHAVINDLPDSHYATLRALVLHLSRVNERSDHNRMSTSNLAICFAPSLMGSHTGPQIADASLQARVLDTILTNTYQIFDED